MDNITYVATIQGLLLTAIEKENVLGEGTAKKEVLEIMDMIEELGRFWSRNNSLKEYAGIASNFISETRNKYENVR